MADSTPGEPGGLSRRPLGEGSDQAPSVALGRAPGRFQALVGFVLVNLATLTWATNIALGRVLRDEIGPLTLSAARYAVTAALCAALLTRQPATDRRVGRDLWLLVGLALSGAVLFAPTLYLGLRFTTSVNATLINSMAPLITGLLAALLIREPMTGRQGIGALLGLAGVAVLISGASADFWLSARMNPGDLIVLCAATLWALYSVLGRRAMRTRSSLSVTAFSAMLGLPLLLVGAGWEVQSLPVQPNPTLLLTVVYIGVVPSLGGILAWNEGVKRLGASGAMVFYNTLPLYGALVSFFFLGEEIGLPHLLGGALIVGGGILGARRR